MFLQEVVQAPTVHQPAHSHAVVSVWALSALVLTLLIIIWVMFKARGGWDYINTMPMTNIGRLTAILMFGTTIVGTGLVGYLAGVWPPEYVLDAVLTAETVWAGIEIGGVWIKRATTNPDIASRQNVLSGVATATMPVPVPEAPIEPLVTPIAPLVSPRPIVTDHDKGII